MFPEAPSLKIPMLLHTMQYLCIPSRSPSHSEGNTGLFSLYHLPSSSFPLQLLGENFARHRGFFQTSRWSYGTARCWVGRDTSVREALSPCGVWGGPRGARVTLCFLWASGEAVFQVWGCVLLPTLKLTPVLGDSPRWQIPSAGAPIPQVGPTPMTFATRRLLVAPGLVLAGGREEAEFV